MPASFSLGHFCYLASLHRFLMSIFLFMVACNISLVKLAPRIKQMGPLLVYISNNLLQALYYQLIKLATRITSPGVFCQV